MNEYLTGFWMFVSTPPEDEDEFSVSLNPYLTNTKTLLKSRHSYCLFGTKRSRNHTIISVWNDSSKNSGSFIFHNPTQHLGVYGVLSTSSDCMSRCMLLELCQHLCWPCSFAEPGAWAKVTFSHAPEREQAASADLAVMFLFCSRWNLGSCMSATPPEWRTSVFIQIKTWNLIQTSAHTLISWSGSYESNSLFAL